jgi:hypothetical protein
MNELGKKAMEGQPRTRKVTFADAIASSSNASPPQQHEHDTSSSHSNASPCIVRVESLSATEGSTKKVLYSIDRTPKLVFAFHDDFMAQGPYQLHLLVPYTEPQ